MTGKRPVETNTSKENFEGMPEGVQAFIKAHNIPLDKPFVSYLYRVRQEKGQTKPRRFYKEKIENGFFEDDFGPEYIKDKYGGGEYQAVTTWKKEDGGKNGIELEPIFIDGPEKEQRESQDPATIPGAAGSLPPPVVAAPGSGFDMEKILKFLPLITAALESIKSLIPKPDFSIFEKLQEQQIKSMDRFASQIQKMQLDSLKARIEKQEQLDLEGGEMQEKISSVWPEWIKPFAPLIEKYAEKLIGDNPISNILKRAVVGSEVFQTAWTDEKKRGEAVEALEKYFGTETAEALEETFDTYMSQAA